MPAASSVEYLPGENPDEANLKAEGVQWNNLLGLTVGQPLTLAEDAHRVWRGLPVVVFNHISNSRLSCSSA
jgi:hypothetical protein